MDADRSLLSNLMLSRGVVDRQAERRNDADWIARHRSASSSQVITVSDGAARMRGGEDGPALLLEAAGDVDGDLTFLGLDDEGIAFFARLLEAPDEDGWATLRDVGSTLNARDAGLMVSAVALDHWHRSHRHCTRCGAETTVSEAGWSRVCTCSGRPHFPRTDPAVIVLVRDRDDRALLGRQGRWAQGWFSTLAGFVEAGESAEAAVRREVCEESGVVIDDGADDLWYLGSQPWPFPQSLMLGYHAWTSDPDTINVDGEEIAEAHWFSREQLVAACTSGEVRLPPDISIARRLIERWYGGELPGDWSRPLGLAR